MHILFVCTGNTCRSPMAEAILKKTAIEKGLCLSCDSAGVMAFPGSGLSAMAKKVLEEVFEISDFDHKAKQVTPEILAKSDLVIAMTEDHRKLLVQKYGAAEKAITLPGGVFDPYGGDFETYKKAADAIQNGLQALLEEGILHD